MADMEDATLGDFFSRPLKIGSFAWDQSITFFQDLNVWSLFWNNPRNVNRISNFALLRCSMKVKILINGNGFHYGRLLVSYNPHPTESVVTQNRALVSEDNVAASQRPSFFLDPTTSTGGSMTLPYWNHNNAMSIPAQDYIKMGNLTIRELNPLKHANDATDQVTISVFAWAENVSLSLPTSTEPGSITPQAGQYEDVVYLNQADEYAHKSLSDKIMAVSEGAAVASSVAPALAPYTVPVAAAAGAASKALKACGFSRPRDIEPIRSYRPTFGGNLANANIEDTGMNLALDKKQTLNVDTRTMGFDGTDELDISSFCARQSYITTFQWPTAASAETMLWNTDVTPAMFAYNGSEIHGTPAFLASTCFRFWRGTLKYRFQIVASAYHKGRLKIVWDPYWFQSNEYNTNYIEIVDIAHTRDFSIDVGWGQPNAYRKCPSSIPATEPYGTSPRPLDVGLNTNGILAVYVVNDLTVPNSLADNDISINVFVSCEDIEFTFPDTLGGGLQTLSYFPEPVALAQLKEEEEYEDQSGIYRNQAGESPDIADTMEENNPEEVPSHQIANTTPLSDHSTFFGDPVSNFRYLFKRYVANVHHLWGSGDYRRCRLHISALPIWPGASPNYQFHQTAAGTPYNYTEPSFLTQILPCFLAYRGSMRHKILMENTGNVRFAGTALATLTTASLAPSSSEEIIDTTNFSAFARSSKALLEDGAVGSVVNMVRFNNTLEYEIPYYNSRRYSYAKLLAPNRLGTPDTAVNIDLVTQLNDPLIHVYMATGEDFTVAGFMGVPIMYLNLDPAAPP